ncbi:cytochrome P450 [Iamia sp. SCSIO 61187]|uniref:cytochrome P450 n=1 Tax=Iamia sp. SCSIO 61187 TaxID=2722752 RepID=UPI0021028F43|nr:cytochrome P450 [Iamia sp. SCSIO 61187]QYG92302.1 cytochrome P450 [Iamia sp. SCSIO 61187]
MSDDNGARPAPRPSPADWATDFDHTHDDYAAAAPEIWDDLRQRCPVAHTDRFGGAWLPTRHDDVSAIAHDTTHFTSNSVIVSDFKPHIPAPVGFAPPITSDPPFHEVARRLLLPAFSPKAIRPLEETTRALCRGLIDAMLGEAGVGDVVDAATAYSQHIPVGVIAHMLGVPPEDGDRFRLFIHRILEKPGQNGPTDTEDTMIFYLDKVIEDHRREPRDDLIGYLLGLELDGKPLSDDHVVGTVALLLIAGIDTTWSAIGASIWHLAQHPEHRQRLVEDPDVMPFAVEEMLRAYAPVTMARIVAEDVEIGGQHLAKDDWVLLPFPAANRDPEFFDRADEVVLDREKNRHSAFGLGIHRCLGSNLARMELRVALEEWMARVPDFELAPDTTVRWSTGQVRGPRELPLRLLRTAEPAGVGA